MGSVRGIPIQVHWSFTLLLAWSGYIGHGMGGWSYVAYSVFLTVLLFGCVVLHELGHALTAQRFGVSTRSITLLPIGGVAALNRIPEKPMEEFLITVAGPMVNVVIAGSLYAWLGWPSETAFEGIWRVESIGTMLMYTNVVMVIFNMIPAFPMDGGRIVRSLLALWLPYHRATAIAAGIGRVIAIVMVVAGFSYNPILILIGFVIYNGANAENRMVAVKARFASLTANDLMTSDIRAVDADDTVETCARICAEAGQRDFIVTSDGRIAGVLPQQRWMACMDAGEGYVPAKRIMQSPVMILDQQMPADAVIRIVQSTRQQVFPVVANGLPVGLITATALRNQHLRGVRSRRSPLERVYRSFMDVG